MPEATETVFPYPTEIYIVIKHLIEDAVFDSPMAGVVVPLAGQFQDRTSIEEMALSLQNGVYVYLLERRGILNEEDNADGTWSEDEHLFILHVAARNYADWEHQALESLQAAFEVRRRIKARKMEAKDWRSELDIETGSITPTISYRDMTVHGLQIFCNTNYDNTYAGDYTTENSND